MNTVSAQAIDELLPQTQCTRCGYPGCRPYADAIVSGEAQINQCPPGGTETIIALAALTGRAVTPLNHRVMHTVVAELCTGCELCVAPCPVDCISMVPLLASPAHQALALPRPDASRARYEAHNERTARRAAERAAMLADKKRGARPAP